MDHVDLPLLTADGSVEDAIKLMNEHDRRFVIVSSDREGYRSLSNWDVITAWKEGTVALRDVTGGQPVLEVPGDATVRQVMEVPWDHPTQVNARRAMESARLNFGISGSPETIEGRIHVLTLHEDVQDRARSKTKECACRNCGSNDSSPPASSGTSCPDCGQDTWRCA